MKLLFFYYYLETVRGDREEREITSSKNRIQNNKSTLLYCQGRKPWPKVKSIQKTDTHMYGTIPTNLRKILSQELMGTLIGQA